MSTEIPMQSQEYYRLMITIRRFEETVLDNFPRGLFYGTTHTYLGQEANAVAVISHLESEDIVFSNHRCHGHFLAYGGDPRALFAELMGKVTGVCGGRGGSQHLHWRNFYSNGVQGGIVPVAVGMALAEKLKRSGGITVAFLGDGTLGEGVIYEAFNLSSIWQAPILFVLENNHIAQTTPADQVVSGSLKGRFETFGIPVIELDTSDVEEIAPIAGKLVTEVRMLNSPRALILHTCRFGPHSKGDDTRTPDEVQNLRDERDPLKILGVRLNPSDRTDIEVSVAQKISDAFQQAIADPLPEPDTLFV